ncbi:CGNR zinc finger domain-containing protein [uncultured Jatrophihabitans sp.]|uniref:CGNR zinc finger domain-containing protein n=1 Tax=uncultured Jatrophihabitans sp. TaxID=1610747 RepID=UPI0035CAEEEC
MLFAHDTEVALAAAVALVNTEDDGGLDSLSELEDFVTAWGWTGSRRRTRAELDSVRALRPRLRAIWSADVHEAVRIVNRLLSEAKALPQLVTHDDWDYHLHATPPHAPLADRMAVEAAMAVVDVIRSGELDRLRTCAADDCANVLVDLSKNRSRRFCESGCGNRANVAAYRARRAATT